jgi:trigger factor
MKATIEDISTVKKKIHIQVSPDAIEREMSKAVADAAKRAKIPGFRPGKAPKAVVERHYSAEIQSEVMNKVISDSYLKALQENDLSPVDMPNITNISPLEKNAPLNFTAMVEVRPKFELASYEGLEIKEAVATVTDAEVDQTIDRLRDMYAQLEVVEGQPLSKDHTAVIDFEGSREGKRSRALRQTIAAQDTTTLIPGFEDQLIGARARPARSRSLFPRTMKEGPCGQEARSR